MYRGRRLPVQIALTVAAVAIVAAAAMARLTSGGDAGRGGPPAARVAPSPGSAEPTAAGAGRRHRYVSPAGDDRNAGSRARPWRTVVHAAQMVGAGTTVHVAPGTYPGAVRIDRSGRADARVRLVSEQPWRARISARGTQPLAAVELRGDYLTLEGFDVTARGPDGTQAIDVEGSHSAVVGNRVHHVSVPCLGSGNGGAGIVAGGGKAGYRNHDILVARNLVHDIGAPSAGCRLVHGIYAAVPRVTIVNNIVVRAIGDGITAWHGARELVIANNLSADNGGAGILVGSGDTGATSGNTGTLVANNIVYRNALQGITEASDGAHRVGPNRYLDNLAFANHAGDQASGWGVGGFYPGAVVSGTVESDPRFAPATADSGEHYVPDPASPAVDAGTSAGAPRTDIRGVLRPQGSGVDIGPYER